ncbi:MAG: phosphatase PAP2 family protein [Bacteroidales bacterium]|nr:phosphatase PAP2 family protein [Bacteroidales bacterium]
MFEQILQCDQDLLLFLNSLHCTFGDYFFWYATNMLYWIPLYVFFIYMLYRQYGKKIWLPLLLLAVTIVLTDQTSNLIKHLVERLRPTHNPGIAHLVQIINDYRGGHFSFPSGHATNTFGVAVFFFRVIPQRRWWLTLALFGWCTIMTYSRIYLGVHYPLDIICGAILGTVLALCTGWMCLKIYQKMNNQCKTK